MDIDTVQVLDAGEDCTQTNRFIIVLLHTFNRVTLQYDIIELNEDTTFTRTSEIPSALIAYLPHKPIDVIDLPELCQSYLTSIDL